MRGRTSSALWRSGGPPESVRVYSPFVRLESIEREICQIIDLNSLFRNLYSNVFLVQVGIDEFLLLREVVVVWHQQKLLQRDRPAQLEVVQGVFQELLEDDGLLGQRQLVEAFFEGPGDRRNLLSSGLRRNLGTLSRASLGATGSPVPCA